MKRMKRAAMTLTVFGSVLLVAGAAGVTVAQEADGPAVETDPFGGLDLLAVEPKPPTGPEWQPSHKESMTIDVGEEGGETVMHDFALRADGTILAGCGGSRTEYTLDEETGEAEAKEITEQAEIRVFDPDGKLLDTWPVEVKPNAIAIAPDGTVLIGGAGRIAVLSADGKITNTIVSPAVIEAEAARKEAEAEAAKKAAGEEDGDDEEDDGEEDDGDDDDGDDDDGDDDDGDDDDGDAEDDGDQDGIGAAAAVLRSFGNILGTLSGTGPLLEPYDEAQAEADMAEAEAAYMAQRVKEVTAIAANERDVFVVCPMTKGYGFAVWRFDRELKNGTLIIDGLRGCCGQMDVQVAGETVMVCENSRKRVTQYDREGKEIRHWGKADRKTPEGFGSCCNPMNLWIAPDGVVYTSESGPPDAVKRFSPEGEYLGLVALPQMGGGCVDVAIQVTADGRRVYVLNEGDATLHVFDDARFTPTHEPLARIDVGGDKPNSLRTFCVAPSGNILAARGGSRTTYVRDGDGVKLLKLDDPAEIVLFDPDGKELDRWTQNGTATAINVAECGTIVAGGEGRLWKLSPEGKELAAADLPTKAEAEEVAKEQAKQTEAMIEKYAEQIATMEAALKNAKDDKEENQDNDKDKPEGGRPPQITQAQIDMMKQRLEMMKARASMPNTSKLKVSGIALTERDIFVCCSELKSYGFAIWRMDHDFANPVKIIAGLRGCCGQMDVQARGDLVFIPENGRGRVAVFDRDGKEVASWGKMDRKDVVGFGSCCNPMNLRIDGEGVVYTSESGLGRIKRFSTEGEFLGLVGTATVTPGCKNVAADFSPDGERVYIMDIGKGEIAILATRPEGEAPDTTREEGDEDGAAGSGERE